MKYLTLFTAIAIAVVAGYFSIAGLATIFSGAFWSIVIMASILEIGKLVTAAYLHLDWDEINFYIRSYLVLAVAVLMLITSMGIFGFLSKAHLENSITGEGMNEIQISNLERQISNEQRGIKDAETVLSQLDQTVQILLDADRVRGDSGALATRKSQTDERKYLNEAIDESYVRIEELQAKLIPYNEQRLAIEVEVGPLKYIAELIYGDGRNIDNAARMVMLLLVFVFDPLAVMLLIVSTAQFKRDKLEKASKGLVDSKQIMVMN
jgi:hypothetical protein